MNNRASFDPLSGACYFEELRIRARSPWHRDQYNAALEHAKSLGFNANEARAHAIQNMASSMKESGIRPAAK